jgi:ATP-binding cassette subfamily B protein
MMAGITLLALAIPQFIRWIIDRGIRHQDLRLLGFSVLGLLCLGVVKGIFTFFQGRWSETASQGVSYDLRNAIHRKLSSLSFSYHDRTETGQILSRSIQDVERIRFLIGRAFLRLVDGCFLFLGTAAVLLYMNYQLALLSLASMPILAYRAFVFGSQFRPIALALQQQLAVLITRLEQNLRGSRVVKAFAQEDGEIERFEEENSRWFNLAARSARLRSFNPPLLRFIANLSSVFIIWFGGIQVMKGHLTLGELVAFAAYLSQLIMPIRRLGTVIPAIGQSVAAGERVAEILDATSEVQDKPDALDLPSVQGRVRFENVSFAYFRRHSILKGISFEVLPGQVIALLGATGCGKSTIINLVPRFYEPTEGRIFIGGYDIRDVTLASLRRNIGIVLQETTLFATTIRENIAFGCPDATDGQIVEAARTAQAHDFIMESPKGYDTEVGERGVTLSGGEKQRIAIARALLKDPSILILDDATSSVDTETEHLIQKALEILMQGRTSFVIAQRFSTLRLADVILVMDRGRIAASGTHDELLHTSGIYAEIYYRQFRPPEEAEESWGEDMRVERKAES